MRPLLCAALLAGSGTAAGQNFDAHGEVLPASTGDVHDPMTGWSSAGLERGVVSVGGIAEYAHAPLITYTQDVTVNPDGSVTLGEREPFEALLVGALAMNLSGAYGLHDRVGVAVSTAFFPYARGTLITGTDEIGVAAGMGDTKVSLPVGVLLRDEDGMGLSAAIVPTVRLPTGAHRIGLGDNEPSAGIVAALGYRADKLGLNANIGAVGRAFDDDFTNVKRSPAQLVAHLAGTWALRENLAAHLELSAGSGLRAEEPGTGVYRSQVPIQTVLGARGRASSGLWWTGGVSFGLNSAVGSSAVRVYGGIGWSTPPKSDDAVGPDVPAKLPEVFTWRVVDPRGDAIEGASLALGEQALGTTDAQGQVVRELKELKPWKKALASVSAQADGYVSVDGLTWPADAAGELLSELEVPLAWPPTPVTLVVTDEAGEPIAATVTVDGLDADAVVGDAKGHALLELPEGTWLATVSADGFGSQGRDFVIAPGNTNDPQSVEVILLPLAETADSELSFTLTDAEGAPLQDVSVRIDGRPVGASASGGQLNVAGLDAGEHKVEVIHDSYRALERQVVLSPGVNPLEFPLQRMPGSVKVIARTSDGAVADASVRFVGPSRLAPAPLGADGERIFVVRPGEWNVLVSSPTHGLQARRVLVPADRTELLYVDVILQGEGGPAELSLSVVDPDGAPVPNASVRLDGNELGTTSTGGEMTLGGLNVGARSLTIQAPRMAESGALELFLVEGPQDRLVTLDYQAGTVKVLARTPTKAVGDAVARFAGAKPVEPLPLDEQGEAWTQLDPGSWSVLVTSEQHGLAGRSFSVAPEAGRLVTVDVVLADLQAGAADLDVTVLDPEGIPAGGVALSLDGTPIGATGIDGLLRLTDIGTGARTLAASGGPYVDASARIDLAEGANAQQVDLAWAPGAVRVHTFTPDGEAVTDAVVRVVGPTSVPPARVDEGGTRLLGLAPGSWQVLVVSQKYGFVAKTVDIAQDATGLTVVDFEMSQVQDGQSAVLVRVVDPDGAPVPGASVSLGGEERGVTGPGGGLFIEGLVPGVAPLVVTAAQFDTGRLDSFEVRPGSQERIVPIAWIPTEVSVTVLDRDGAPVEADIRLDGPVDVPAVATNALGKATVGLRPGHWNVVAVSTELGVKAGVVDVASGDAAKQIELRLDKARVKVTADAVEITEKIPFDLDKATLKPSAKAVLDEVAGNLLANPGVTRVEVQGHTDTSGPTLAYNLSLSERRADAVVAALIERGVAPERLVARGYGATKPVASNGDEAGRSQNRRVQFEILETSASDQ